MWRNSYLMCGLFWKRGTNHLTASARSTEPSPVRWCATGERPRTCPEDCRRRSLKWLRQPSWHWSVSPRLQTVMIPEKARRTVCISTQVGCPMGCTFCATGLLGIKRNLKAREIAEQVFVCARDIAPERVTNVVVMGMGEPMLNYNATLEALRVLNDPDGFGLAARHIAVSTSGLVEKIRRFADEPEQFHLAISLHTPFEDERREIMPVAARHTIPELMDAARYYVTRTRRKLFFEYTLLAGVNDQPRHIEALAELLDHPLYHLNLLRFNWTDTGFSATSKAEAKRFLGHARELGLSATLRPSRGQEIDAACGQLAAKDLRGRPAVPTA